MSKNVAKLPNITGRRIIANSKLFTVEQLDLEFSNGEKRIYERLLAGKNGAVLVVPILDDDTFLLIREYAAGFERYELGFPKGLVEDGETAEKASNRELQEETGYGAGSLKKIRTISLAPGYLSHQMDLVLAQDLYPSRLQGDEPEKIEIVPWKFSEIDQLLIREDFTEARSIAALYLVKELLEK